MKFISVLQILNYIIILNYTQPSITAEASVLSYPEIILKAFV